MKTDFKRKFISIAGSVVMLAGLLPGLVAPATAVAADATTSLHIVKYASDGTTVVDETTVSVSDMESSLPVQGDGVTHYWTQGPTFDPTDLWNPAETLNLKDKGALKGTDIKDLCELVGGAASGDTINVRASDGYNETFQFENVYNPLPGQGPMVICWSKDGSYSGSAGWTDGMMLAFFTSETNADGQYVFGHQDMQTYLPPENWHYYWEGPIQYPSAHGLSIKYIDQISIVEGGTTEWSINVTGALTQPVSQGWFEDALACHATASWTDSTGHVWTGLPLWYVVGLVDDTTIHGPGAFNDALAAAGYDIDVVASDTFTKTFASALVARNDNIILADKMDGVALDETSYPLKLVGPTLTSGQRVGKIASINLRNIPVIDTWQLALEGASDYTMTQAEFESGVICPTDNHAATFTNTDGTYKGLPLWLLCGWVDDDVQHGAGAFNDALAASGYQIKVSATDGYYFTFGSADVARNDGIIVANTLNDAPLSDGMYPLRLIGGGFAGGSGWQVREIVKIELLDLPTPSYNLTVNTVGNGSVAKVPDQASYDSGTSVELSATADTGWTFAGWSGDLTGTANPATITMDGNKTVTATFTAQQWSLALNGMSTTTMSQADFESLADTYPLSWTDSTGNVYTGVALWRLVGKVDDGDPATMNDTYAAKDYNVSIIASDGYSKPFVSSLVLNNDNMIIANRMNGDPLSQTGSKPPYPLKLVGPGLTSGQMVSKIATIQFNIPWDIQLVGAATATVTNTQFEASALANPVSWIDGSNTWSGLALWRLIALVDDADPTTFNDTLASIGYSVKITASDGFNKTFAVADLARNDSRIIASKYNGATLGPDRFPVRFVGPGLSGGQMVSKIVTIELLNIPTLMEAFTIKNLNVDYRRQDDHDAIVLQADFDLPDGVTCNPKTDVVTVNIDGFIVSIPADSFRAVGKTWNYNSNGNTAPKVNMVINFKKGQMTLFVRKANVDIIDNYDGVLVSVSIGSIIGQQTIAMFVDSLSYPRVH